MRIGILQTGHAPDELRASLGDYPDMFRNMLAGHGFDFSVWSVVDGDFPPGPKAADGWLITGSKHGVYEDHPWIPPLEDLIRAIDAQRLPLIGVCFGHQIIAQALGGKVVKFPGGWSVGRTTYMMDGREVVLNAWHQDQVVDRPPTARVLGSNAFCENAVLAYGDHIWTVQPHPEFGPELIDGLIQGRGRGVVPDDLLRQAADNLDQPTDNHLMASHMAGFLKKARA